MIPKLNDSTPVTDADIDWSLFDPDKVEHVRSNMLGHALATGQCTQHLVAACLVTFGRKDTLSVSGRGRSKQPVDLREPVNAQARYKAAEMALDGARGEYVHAVRLAYRDGATAAGLANALGISVSRVNQLVSGARAGLT